MLSSVPGKQFMNTPMLQLSPDFQIQSEDSVTNYVDDNLNMLKWIIIEETPEETDVDVSDTYQKTLEEIVSILTYSPAFPRGPHDLPPPPFLPSTLNGEEIPHRENVLKWFLVDSGPVVGQLDTLKLVFQYYAHYLSEESWIDNPTDSTTLALHNTYWEKSYDLAHRINPDILESIRLDLDHSRRTLAVDGFTYFHVSDFLSALENGPRVVLIETHGRIMEDMGIPDSTRVQIHTLYDFHEGTFLDSLSMFNGLQEVGRLRTMSQLLQLTSDFADHETVVNDLSLDLLPMGLVQIARDRLNTIRNFLYEDVLFLYGEFKESNKSTLSMITNKLGLSPFIQEIMERNLSGEEDRTAQLINSLASLVTTSAETTRGTLAAVVTSSQSATVASQSATAAVLELKNLVSSMSATNQALISEGITSSVATYEEVKKLATRQGGTDNSESISLLTTMVDSESKTNRGITITILVLLSIIFLGILAYLVRRQLRKPRGDLASLVKSEDH
jgi:hypothetical protein